MSPHRLLADLRQQGVTLERRGDRLRVDAPQGVLTPEIRADLVAHKAAILQVLASPPTEPAQTVRDLRAAWAGACYELAEALGWPETPYKPAHAVAPGPIPWRRFAGVASIPDLQRVLGALHETAQRIEPPLSRDVQESPGP